MSTASTSSTSTGIADGDLSASPGGRGRNTAGPAKPEHEGRSHGAGIGMSDALVRICASWPVEPCCHGPPREKASRTGPARSCACRQWWTAKHRYPPDVGSGRLNSHNRHNTLLDTVRSGHPSGADMKSFCAHPRDARARDPAVLSVGCGKGRRDPSQARNGMAVGGAAAGVVAAGRAICRPGIFRQLLRAALPHRAQGAQRRSALHHAGHLAARGHPLSQEPAREKGQHHRRQIRLRRAEDEDPGQEDPHRDRHRWSTKWRACAAAA